MKLKNLLLYAAMLAFAAACFIAFRADIARISFDAIWAARNAVLLAALLSLFNYLLRTVRWSIYLAHLGYHFPASFTGLTYLAGFAFTLSPGKVGEMVRARYYKHAGVPLSSTAAAFFIERLMDVLAMTALALLGIAMAAEYRVVLGLAAGVMVAVLAALAAMHRMLDGILRTLVSARALLHPGLLAFGFLLGLVAWGAEGIGLMVLGSLAPAVPLDWATATGIYAIAIIAGALSFLPGGLGGTEVVMIALLAAHGYPLPDAILLTLVCRILTLWLAVAIGWVSILALRHYPEPALEKP